MNKEFIITVTENTDEDIIDSILLSPEFMHQDIEWKFKCDYTMRDKTMELSKLYGIKWDYI